MARFQKHGEKHVDPDDVWHAEVRVISHFEVVVINRNGHGQQKAFTSPAPTDDVGREFEASYDKLREGWIDRREEALRKAERLITELRTKAAAEGRKLTFNEISKAAGFADIGKMSAAKQPDKRLTDILDEMEDAA